MNLSWDYLQPAVTAWASQNAAQLVTSIEQDLKTKLKAQIAGGLSEGKSLYQIRDEIGALQNDEDQVLFSQARAGLIARTEVIRAHSQGAAIGYEKSGVVRGMKWLDGQSGACPKCRELNNKIVPLGQPFYSDPHFGDGLPPRHPNCHCAVAPITVDQAKELPADSPLRNDQRASVSELTDFETYTDIHGLRLSGEQRWHYIRRHFTPYNRKPAQVQDLQRAETLMNQMLAGQSQSVKTHKGAQVYYAEWNQNTYLAVPVKDGVVKSLYLKSKRKLKKLADAP